MTKDYTLWYKSDQIINKDIGEDTVICDFASELPPPAEWQGVGKSYEQVFKSLWTPELTDWTVYVLFSSITVRSSKQSWPTERSIFREILVRGKNAPW